MRIGCSTIPLAPLSGEEAVRTLARLGFQVIDIAAVPTVFEHIRVVDSPPDQPERFAALVEELDLEVNAVPTVVWLPDALDDLAELRRRLTVAADVAAAVGAKCWIVDAGQPVGEDRAAGLDRLKRTVAVQHELAVERGLRLAVEAPHAGTLAERYEGIADVLRVVTDVDADIALDLDTSHLHNCGAPAETVIAEHAHRIAHVAIRDTVAPHQWDMRLGEGNVDFPTIIRQLDSVGFDGDLMIELEPSGNVGLAERIERIVHAREYLTNILGEIVDPTAN